MKFKKGGDPSDLRPQDDKKRLNDKHKRKDNPIRHRILKIPKIFKL
jgi:hypothetical protein